MYRRTIIAGAGLAFTSLAGCFHADDPMSKPAYDRFVRLENRYTDQQTVQITISHEQSGETVHDENYSVAPDDEVDVYDFRDAPTEGVEAYSITGELETGLRAVTQYRTSRCNGNPIVSITTEGEISATYSTC